MKNETIKEQVKKEKEQLEKDAEEVVKELEKAEIEEDKETMKELITQLKDTSVTDFCAGGTTGKFFEDSRDAGIFSVCDHRADETSGNRAEYQAL